MLHVVGRLDDSCKWEPYSGLVAYQNHVSDFFETVTGPPPGFNERTGYVDASLNPTVRLANATLVVAGGSQGMHPIAGTGSAKGCSSRSCATNVRRSPRMLVQ